MDHRLSEQYFSQAERVIPGGVNSPVRCFRSVESPPIVAGFGRGAMLYDVDDNEYIDLMMTWGATILGHAHPVVVEAISRASRDGLGFGLCTAIETQVAERICEAVGSVDQVRMVNSGTEAVMSAVRLARGYTGRSKVLMFEGGYHGHSDGLLAKAGSGLATLSLPGSAGISPAITADTLLAKYNDLDSVLERVAQDGPDIACILIEPVAGNMGVVPPADGFLQSLREVADRIGALLIFDEVITGFRVGYHGAQGHYGVTPDLTTLGKIIGGGLPVGAFGGRREIMQRLAPVGDVYQAGTLSGNPVVMHTGLAVLNELQRTQPYDAIDRAGKQLADTLSQAAERAGVPLRIHRVGGMFTLFFSSVTFEAGKPHTDAAHYSQFHTRALEAGILLPPSPWETCFLSPCHLEPSLLQRLTDGLTHAITG